MNGKESFQKYRKQSFYHDNDNFDFEKFYTSFYSFAYSIHPEGDLFILSHFIYGDSESIPFVQIKLPEKHRSIPSIKRIENELERSQIDLSNSNNDELAIFKLYNFFTELDPDNEKGPLGVHSIKELINGALIGYEADKISSNRGIVDLEEEYLEGLIKNYSKEARIEEFDYLPIPIISRGGLVGVFYLILRNAIGLKQFRRLLILHATREYESIFIASKSQIFENEAEDPLEDYLEVIQDLTVNCKIEIDYEPLYGFHSAFRPVISDNEFLLKLGYDKYYSQLFEILKKETGSIQDIKRDTIRAAIIAIIVDSFGHNVGAHSLVALKWWFENRYRLAEQSFKKNNILPIADKEELKLISKEKLNFHSFMDGSEEKQSDDGMSLLDMIRFSDGETYLELLKNDSEGSLNSSFPLPVSQSIYHYFKYLRDKSAFWNGVTRDVVFSGRVRSWSYLLREFLNNTLFLGTIAHSEGINKINTFIEILDDDSKIIISGEYAKVNMDIIGKTQERLYSEYSDGKKYRQDRYSENAYLRKGEKFDEIQEELDCLDNVFLPNGIIGQHALYTMLENTLRNIKHYKHALPDCRDNGLNLYISIQEVPYINLDENSSTKNESQKEVTKSLFKVGSWLHHQQDLITNNGAFVNTEKNRFHEKGSIIDSHTQQLKRRVIDENGAAILGGSSQDKVCAAMLMNNSFLSIDAVNLSKVKRQYFPYVFPASEDFNKPEERVRGMLVKDDIFHSLYNENLNGSSQQEWTHQYKEEVSKYIDSHQNGTRNSKGLIKKFFHLWKGEKSKLLNLDYLQQHENLSRYKVVVIEPGTEKIPNLDTRTNNNKELAYTTVRTQGVVRVVMKPHDSENYLSEQDLFEDGMQEWLGNWVGKEGTYTGITFYKPAGSKFGPIGAVFLHKIGERWKLTYLNYRELRRASFIHDQIDQFDSLLFAHGKEDQDKNTVCQIRNHGSFMSSIFDGFSFSNLNKAKFKSLDHPAKLFETIKTNITIFDDRAYERLPFKESQKSYPLFSQLNLEVLPEDSDIFDKEKRRILSKQGHFFIIHLSFIESIYKDKLNKIKYEEHEVADFFRNEIVTYYEAEFKSEFPSNFILVITSGRGRGDWFSATKDPQITFRPIEAVIGQLEDGLRIADDFQVKYNLCNVLFGS